MAGIRSSSSFKDERSAGSMLSEYSGLTHSVAASGVLKVMPWRCSAEASSEGLNGSSLKAASRVLSAPFGFITPEVKAMRLASFSGGDEDFVRVISPEESVMNSRFPNLISYSGAKLLT